MFTEILRIKPKLSEGDAKAMESRLSSRFSRVSKRFGQGLKAAMKGTFVGISLGFLAKLLDPLKEVEERIKNLLKQGEDTSELADRFGTSQGKIRRLQDVSNVIGVTPDRLNELMTKYAEAVEKGRLEMESNDPNKEKSASTLAVKNFLNQKDMAEGFFSFIRSLKAASESDRTIAENEVFGNTQTGAARKLINADFDKEFKRLGGASTSQLDKALTKLADLAEKDRLNSTRQDQKTLIQSTGKISGGTIDAIAAAKARQDAQDQKELSQLAAMQKAQAGIDVMVDSLNNILSAVRTGVGHLGNLIKWLNTSSMGKAWTKFFGK